MKSCESHCFRTEGRHHIGLRFKAHEAAIGHEMLSWCDAATKFSQLPRRPGSFEVAEVPIEFCDSHRWVPITRIAVLPVPIHEHPPGRNSLIVA